MSSQPGRGAVRVVVEGAVALEGDPGAYMYVIARGAVDVVKRADWVIDVGPDGGDAGGRIVAVGTTALRALESAARGGTMQARTGETDIFITPGFHFNVVDALLTNFHLPRSTLLMLISAFAGHEHWRRLYAHAVRARYRFFSYGDAMLLERMPP